MDAALRALAAGALRWLPEEPWLHRKRLLAEHAAEDGEPTGLPGGEDLALLLSAAATATEWQRLAYGEVKPALARAARATGDPGLIPVALRQERHALELPVRLLVLPIEEDPALEHGSAAAQLRAAVEAAHDAARAGDAHGAAGHLLRAARTEAATVLS
jgi:hypothetical protein